MDAALQRFYNFLTEERHLSDSTVASYRSDISHFELYYGEKLTRASEKALNSYIESLKNAGKSSSTISRNMVSLRALYGYLANTGIIKTNPIAHLELPKVDKKLPQILSSAEITALLEAPQCTDAKGYRDKAMLELLYATGIRVSELISLNVSNINLRRALLMCPGVTGARVIPMGKVAVSAVSAYLKNARKSLVSSGEESALFVNCSGKRMTRQGFWKLIKGYQSSAAIDKDITPHMLRHSFAAHLLENGADLDSIGEMMGLSDSASTAVYKRLLENKIFDIYKKSHPRA